MKISYNWLKWYIPEVVEAEKLADVFSLHLCEVESVDKTQDGDTVFDLNILPNRAHDLLSHHGVARELAGQLGIKFNDPSGMYKVPESKKTDLKIEIEDSRCRRYMGRIVRNIKVGPSPEWVVKHLESIGQRSINNIVDATNICMYDCGQPMHAFDLKKISGNKITIRNSNERDSIDLLEEVIQTKGGVPADHRRKLFGLGSSLLICDEQEPIALAGVKGGTKAKLTPIGNGHSETYTTDILLEVANFDPATVRRAARVFNILTDSAKRFENDLSPELASFGMKELTGLIVEMCPDAIFEDVVDVYPSPQEKREITFSVEQISKKLGIKISKDQVEDILKRYNFEYKQEDDFFTVTIPPLRLDLVGVHDMVEEIGRIIGYDKIAPTIPKIQFKPKLDDTYSKIETARQKLIADGYSEVMTYAFTKKGKVEVARAPKGKEFLRTNLSDGLKSAFEVNRLNAPLLEIGDVRIFEIGSVFPEIGKEEIHVGYADKKGVIESALEEFVKDVPLVQPSSESKVEKPNTKVFKNWSQFPFITRDIALWVREEADKEKILLICEQNGGELLVKKPYVFDMFKAGDGKISIAVRLVFQSFDRTLLDSDIALPMERIVQNCKEQGFEVR